MNPGSQSSETGAEFSRRRFFAIGAMAVTAGVIRGNARPESSGAEGSVAPDSLLIRGGLVVTAAGRRQVDVLVRGERIAEIGRNLKHTSDVRLVEAEGLQVLPGGIDPHAHLCPPWVDDYSSGSRAAVAGGITTIGCMTRVRPGERLGDALDREKSLAQQQAITDIFFHPIIGAASEGAADELPRLIRAGHNTIKIFMTGQGFMDSLDEYIRLIRAAGSAGILTMLHCEDAALMAQAAGELKAKGQTSLRYYAESRPTSSEVKAVEAAARICREAAAPVYVVHLSSQAALRVCREARDGSLPLFVETRPIYLYFTRERYLRPDGPLYVGQPPLRDEADVQALWQGLNDGAVDTLGTDHAPWTREQKMDPASDIHRLRPGVADLQTMLPVFYSEGVSRNRIPLEKFVALTSSNPARLFGLYPRKGEIAVGSDADIVLWDPAATRKLERADLLSRAGFSLHEGWELKGWPKMTIRRGEVVCEDGRVLASPGTGRIPLRGPTQKLSQS